MRQHLSEGGLLVQWLPLYEFDLRLVASVLKALSPHFERCAGTMMHMDRQPVLFELGTSLTGFLRPPELREIWHYLETQPCTTSLTVVERYWWNLFEAVGNRDLHAMEALF